MENVQYEAQTKTIQDIIHLYRNNHLNLEPPFQRDSVWKITDRAKLIDSILRGYPLPAIFLSTRHENGHLIHDVLDGKQRLESILMFCGEVRGQRFKAKVTLVNAEQPEFVDWTLLNRRGLQHLITGHKL